MAPPKETRQNGSQQNRPDILKVQKCFEVFGQEKKIRSVHRAVR
jgi:hypothetical protein